MASVCGTLGPWRRRRSTASATSSARRLGRRRAAVHPAREGHEGYKTDLNNVAPSASIAWRPDVQSGFLRTLLGDPESGDAPRRLLGGLRAPGPDRFTDLYGGNRGGIDLADPQRQHRAGAGRASRGRCCCRRPTASIPRPFNPDPTYPIAVGANRADSLNAFAPDIKIARVRNWTVGFARSISKDMAVEIRYVGNRGDNEWSAINYNCGTPTATTAPDPRREPRRQRVHERVQARDGEPQANNASGVANARRLVRLLRRRHRHQPAADLPGLPQRQPRRRQPGRLRQRRHDHLGELRDRRPARRRRTRIPTARRSISTAT